MDVGCNKGYTSAYIFALWAPEVGLTPKEIRKRHPGIHCGICNDCNDDPKPALQHSRGSLSVYCVEPSLNNFQNVSLTRDLFFRNFTNPDINW